MTLGSSGERLGPMLLRNHSHPLSDLTGVPIVCLKHGGFIE
jgi:hypothetical protein